MEKRFIPQKIEKKIYQFWQENHWFTPKIDKKKKPFIILLPPPNANDPLHLGHAMYVVEDILCRWHRMRGEPTLFLPGTDHAGLETQFVFEKKLNQEGKSRFDFDRETLYQMIKNYVEENRGIAKRQLKQLGFSLDWTREKYTLDPKGLKIVFETFKKLHQDGLVYRGNRIVNYCPSCGTALSDLEVNYVEKDDQLYYLDYGTIKIATTRPETIFADVAVAVNPQDRRYKHLVGEKAILPLVGRELPIIADELVETDFGSGALKITPAHDVTDFEIGQRHHLPSPAVIDTNGKIINAPNRYLGLKTDEARKKVVADLEKAGKLLRKEPLHHSVGICYRCKNLIEPLLMPQWFIKIKPLAKSAIRVVKDGKVKIIPKRFEKIYFNWLINVRDWNISRQVVWGPRIPIWYCLDCNPGIIVSFINQKGEKVIDCYKKLRDHYSFNEIEKGLQVLTAPVDVDYFLEEPKYCPRCKSEAILQETDTFDTWFSSGQWPLTALGFPNSEDFKYFYPTSVLDTMWDILFFWVARMIMLCTYRTGEVPFKIAHMHSRVLDEKGLKMSKSKGNVLDPIELVQEYGADALRMALVYGVAPASDIALSRKKIEAMRNFTNKIWNAARFIYLIAEKQNWSINLNKKPTVKDDKKILTDLDQIILTVNNDLESYRFGQALEKIYQFFWHNFCDFYIEKAKNRPVEALPTLINVLGASLKLLHPFAPFITEEIYQTLGKKFINAPKNKLFVQPALIISKWPEKKTKR